MRKNHFILIFFLSAAIVIIPSCEKGKNETKISQNGGTHSHNMGRNCMDCHKSGGEGNGWFNAAGTVYNAALTATYPNTTINLYTGPNGTGTLVATLYGDAKGNFYTTAAIDIAQGLYPSVTGTLGGVVRYMSTTLSTGACNSCHGVSTSKIWAE